MKKLTRRAMVLLLFAAILFGGAVYYTVEYFVHAEDWVSFTGETRPQEYGLLRTGTIVDRENVPLLSMADGRTYHGNAALRRANVHLLGDRSGSIPSALIQNYAVQFSGYSVLNGLYSARPDGETMRLTISADAQKKAMLAMGDKSGVVLVYNYRTGEILCAVSAPGIDPERTKIFVPGGAYLNRIVSGEYTPGSVFELVTAAAALEELDGKETKDLSCGGEWKVGEDSVRCALPHGKTDLKTALAKSCNCTFAQLAVQLGEDRLTKFIGQTGVFESDTMDGFLVRPGKLNFTDASDLELAWTGIGQHTVQVNPVRFLRFVGAIAGGGCTAEPYLVRSVGDYQSTVRISSRIMSEKTAETLAEDMEYCAETAYYAESFPEIRLCAKSGVTEVGAEKTLQATFAGFIRDTDYPLAFLTIVENSESGSEICVPIVSEVLNACMEALDAERK